jgi:transposase
MPLTDEQWAVIQPLLPPASPALHGRPPVAERQVLDAILWKIRTSTPWYDLPPGLPSWQTCYRRYHHWQRQGFLSAVFTALDHDLRDRAGLDLRAALAAQRIRYVPLGAQAHIIFDPSIQATLHETWQLETVYLLLAVLFQALRKKFPVRRLRLVSPGALACQPAPLPQPDC